MKSVLLTCILAFSISSSFSQITICPEAGIGINKILFEDNWRGYKVSPKPDINLGALCHYNTSDIWKLSFGLKYHSFGCDAPATNSDAKLRMRLRSLELPVIVSYKAYEGSAGKIYLGAGGYFDIASGLTVKYSDRDTSFTLNNDTRDIWLERAGIGVGAILNAEYHLKNPLYFRIQYQYAVTQTLSYSRTLRLSYYYVDYYPTSGFSRGISIIVGYKFSK